MDYIVLNKPGEFQLREKEEPEVQSNEVLLKIRTIGICGTDLHAYQGNQAFFNYPRILGHELGAEVLSLGSRVTGFNIGDKVMINPYLNCGQCIACRQGKTNCCEELKVLGVHTDGGMQEKITLKASQLLKVNDLSWQAIALVEPLSIGAHAVRRADLKKGEFAVVLGCGPIGLGIMKMAKNRGARVIAIDTVEKRLEFARVQIGADHIINAGNNPIEAVAKITGKEMAPAVFDATGNKFALESGPDFMAHGGRFILVGLFKGDLTYNQPAIQAKEASILCSRNATLEDFKVVLEVLKTGQFPVDAFITHKIPFRDLIGHFDSWLDREAGVIKAMVEL